MELGHAAGEDVPEGASGLGGGGGALFLVAGRADDGLADVVVGRRAGAVEDGYEAVAFDAWAG